MKKLMIASLVCLIGLFVASTVASAEEAVAAVAQNVTVKGTVELVKDDAGAVTAITIKPAKGDAVKVAMDKEGKKLEAMAGKKVEATGVMGDNGLVVKSCKEVMAEM